MNLNKKLDSRNVILNKLCKFVFGASAVNFESIETATFKKNIIKRSKIAV